jgi:hypothetical protein
LECLPLQLSKFHEEKTNMSNGRAFDEPTMYQIKVQGSLGPQWSDWFDGFTIDAQAQGETLRTGTVADQAALHGVLAKLRDLGLPILLVKRLKVKEY